jgi:hypothetical protein
MGAMKLPPVPRQIVLALSAEQKTALARSARDHHRPPEFEAEHLVIGSLVGSGYLDAELPAPEVPARSGQRES